MLEPLESRTLFSTTLASSAGALGRRAAGGGALDAPAASVIDLLALATPQAIAAAGDNSALLSRFNQEIDAANTAFANSNIPVTLRLLALSGTSYNESGDMSRDLTRLATPGDGYMDDTLQLRNLLGADLVVLLESQGTPSKTGTIEGISTQLLSARGAGQSSTAYIVIDDAASLDHYVLAHEVGHTLGATHAVGDPQARGATAYAHGYRFMGTDGVQYHDIMAYDPGVRIPYFSDPDIIYAGVPIGDAKTADAARLLRDDAPKVAAYRTAAPLGAIQTTSLSQITGYDYDPVTKGAATLRVDIDGVMGTPFLGDDGRQVQATAFAIPAHGFTFTLPLLSKGRHKVQLYGIDSQSGAARLLGTTFINSPTPLFDEAFYLANNPDVVSQIAQGAFKSAWDQFNRVGQFEARDPSPYFNTQFYLAHNPSVATALQKHRARSAFAQFLSAGEKQGLAASTLFDEQYYLATYPDVAALVKKGKYRAGLEHYLLVGMQQNLSPLPPA